MLAAQFILHREQKYTTFAPASRWNSKAAPRARSSSSLRFFFFFSFFSFCAEATTPAAHHISPAARRRQYSRSSAVIALGLGGGLSESGPSEG